MEGKLIEESSILGGILVRRQYSEADKVQAKY